MKSDKPKKREPIFGSEHIPQIQIIVPQACIDYREKPEELILVEESLFYISAIFHVLMMFSDKEVHRGTDAVFAIRTLGLMGKAFSDIAMENADLLEVKTDEK